MMHASVSPAAKGAAPASARGVLQRKCSCAASGTSCARCEGGRPPVQRKPSGPPAGPGVPPAVDRVLASPGRALDPSSRATMERGFGRDFSHVRIHSGEAAAESARAVRAHAYTVGDHIVLGDGVGSLHGGSGRDLLAHELAHVVQQSGGGGGAQPEALEQEADRAAQAIGGGVPFEVRGSAAPSVQRKADDSTTEFLKQKAIEGALSALGLNSTALKLVGAGIGGAIEGFRTQWTDGGTGQRLGKHLSEFSLKDVPALLSGYVQGVIQGVVSPITDLFSLFVLMEQGRDFAAKLAESALFGKSGQQAELDAILQSIAELVAPMRAVVQEMKSHPLATLKSLLEFASSQGPMMGKMEDMATNAGLSGGKAIALSLEEPWEKKEKKEEPKFSIWKQPAQWANQKLEQAGEALLSGPWGRVGNKAGYALGFAVVQIVLLVFSDGIGNFIASIGRGMTTIAKAGTLLGKTLEGVGKFVQAAGAGIRAVEEAVAAVIGFLSKPLLPVLEPLMKPFGKVMDRLSKFLRKLFGVAEKESAHLAATAVAKTEGALVHAPAPPTPPHAPAAAPAQPHAPAAAPKPAPHAADIHAGKAVPPPDVGAAKAAHVDAAPAPKPHADAPPAAKARADSRPAATPHADTPPAATPKPADKPHADAAVQAKPGPADGRGKIMADEPVDGHHLRVREGGQIELCSPEPCPLLEHIYGDIIGGSVPMKAEMKAIQALRKSNPKLAAKRTAALKKQLDAIASKHAPNQKALDKEYEGFMDWVREEGGDPSKMVKRRPGKTSGSTAPAGDPLAQDIGFDIDEIKPVGGKFDLQGKPVPFDERMKAATALENREIKDSLTNQRTKGVRRDPRDAARLAQEPKVVSLKPGSGGKKAAGNEHLAFFDRRLDEIEEFRVVHDKVLRKVQQEPGLTPGEVKERLNAGIREEFKHPTTPEGEVIAGAIERGGFGYVEVTAPNGKKMTVLRALTEQELISRGYVFSKRGGWIKTR
ncbi:DUF4157 domain-containing protein [Duganella sp. BJB1802]|uniref:eCIS core domain-containing protein n=1 Tax=Duganella sp. BJB1802 TaxID=2744575 RepID=UPI0015944BCF|nr:DUF4157 domain-containing protein [Duganella sp. BJB1802]NVD72550.1 DUF4157 domain-containing protein [Duganella sp. BJB1802]